MRRMICHAMDYVRQFCDLHQAFTSDKVVSHMWSLSPNCRTNEVYQHLLKELDGKLYSLPWARTGVAPDGTVETDSTLQKENHQFGQWVRHELRSRMEPLVLSSELEELAVFYDPAVHRLWNRWSRNTGIHLNATHNVLQLCSLELSRRHFSLRPCRCSTEGIPISISDMARHHLGMPGRVLRKYASRTRSICKRCSVKISGMKPW